MNVVLKGARSVKKKLSFAQCLKMRHFGEMKLEPIIIHICPGSGVGALKD